MTHSPPTIDQKRTEYRAFLERNGVTAVLTKLLVHLYEEPERPADPILYIREKLNASLGKLETHEQAQEVEMLSKQVARLELALAEKIGPENAAKIKQGVTSSEEEVAEEAKEIITEKKDEEKTDELAKVDDVKAPEEKESAPEVPTDNIDPTPAEENKQDAPVVVD